MAKKIVVLMGGNSSEREVSLASGRAVLKSLQKSQIPCFGFDWYENGADNLSDLFTHNFDKVFIALHGKGGEDGYIQEILESKNIEYTGTRSANSKKCLDKHQTKQICKEHNLLTANWQKVQKEQKISTNLNLPLAVKPTLEGSSIGISKVEEPQDLQIAVDLAFKYGDEVILEEWINGKEYSVAIVKNQVFPVVEIIASDGFYDFEAKYKSTTTQYQCPANLDAKNTKKIQNIAQKVFKVMGMQDWGRVDFICKDDEFYILEVNTVPGMTSHSLVPMSAKAFGVDFDELVLNISS